MLPNAWSYTLALGKRPPGFNLDFFILKKRSGLSPVD